MKKSVEHQARRTGAVVLNVQAVLADIQVVTDARAGSAWVELTALNGDENAVEVIHGAEFREDGGEVFLNLREDKLRTIAGGSQVGRSFGGGTVRQTGGSFSVGNGTSMINGVSIGRILVRAILPPGSALDAGSTSGDVETKGVEQVNARTVSGDISVSGLRRDSNLNSVSGDITVSGTGDPRVNANTVSGDVTGRGVRLRASSVSGRVRER